MEEEAEEDEEVEEEAREVDSSWCCASRSICLSNSALLIFCFSAVFCSSSSSSLREMSHCSDLWHNCLLFSSQWHSWQSIIHRLPGRQASTSGSEEDAEGGGGVNSSSASRDGGSSAPAIRPQSICVHTGTPFPLQTHALQPSSSISTSKGLHFRCAVATATLQDQGRL